MPVGRLDINSEGLLLLTNDGALKRMLELPATGWLRRYRVRVYGTVRPDALKALEDGIEIDGVRYGSIKAEEETRTGANAWLKVGLREGKNREVRRVLLHLGLEVSRLIRTAYGPFQLGALKRGGIEEVTPKVLKEQLGGMAAQLTLPPSRSHAAAKTGAGKESASRQRRASQAAAPSAGPRAAPVSPPRIIAGRHRGRRLEVPAGTVVRPSAERLREAVFSMLEHRPPGIAGRCFLDLFAGSGAIGLEALSRGAARLIAVEADRAVAAALRRNLAKLGESERARLLIGDATRLPRATAPADIVYLDPPYESGLAAPALASLIAGGWLAEGALVVVELAAREGFEVSTCFTAIDERRYGAGRIVLLEVAAALDSTAEQ